MSEANKATIRRAYQEIWSQGNLALIDELYHPDFVLNDPGAPGVRSPDGYRRYVASMRAAFPDVRFTIEQQLADGEQVVTRWVATGTNTGPLFGMLPATGKSGSTTGITIARLAGGKIVEETSNWDALGMLQGLGVIPRMG
jgi:steroid delta-isomerase-like uncharacterized protein